MQPNPSASKKDSPRPRRMRTFFNGFVVGVLVTAAVSWYLIRQAREHPEAEEQFRQASSHAAAATAEALLRAREALKAKLDTLDLKPEQVEEELARTGQVVRRRAREMATQVADTASDARVTAVIKARLATERDLSVWTISVSTSNGHVKLDGNVSNFEQVAKAVALAMDVEGVRDVTSNLKVKPKQP